jgi:hypothetical protein
MTIEKIKSKVIASIWQAIAQSSVDLSEIKQEDQEKLVQDISNSVLVAFDSLLEDQLDLPSQNKNKVEEDEKILWEGRPFLSLVESYVISNERIKLITGMISRNVENFELIRIQDIDYKQNVGERIFGIGDLTIRGHDSSDPIIVLRNISNPEEVYELLRKSWLAARKRHGLQFREYM